MKISKCDFCKYRWECKDKNDRKLEKENKEKKRMNDQTTKADDGKPRVDLVSPYLIEAVGYIRGYGAKKYGDSENWQQVEKERYMAAALRHFCEVMKDFKSVDKESGYLHLWHCACNINFLIEMLEKEKTAVCEVNDDLKTSVSYMGENY